MNDQALCPTSEELTKLSHGDLSGDRFEAISRHLEVCANCQDRLSDLETPPDDFTRALAKLDRVDLENAGQRIDSESRMDSQTWLRQFFESTSGLSRRRRPMLETPCQIGPYEILRRIGQGGMGEVYEARHVRLKRPVAVKVIRGHRRDDPVANAYFLQEMSTAGKFDHPNLVRAYDAWEENECLYLVLELLEGESLQKLVAEGQGVSTEDVRQIMLDLCRALEHLHSNGLVHRDVKPSNVMILRNGAVKLLDYGLTRSLEPEPGRQTKIEGTLGYMAPEQARPGGHVDVRSDIYSAGRVLQFLLRNLPESSEGLHKSEQIRKLETIAARMTEPDPKERYADIAEVQQALDSTDSPPDGHDRRRAFIGLGIMAVIIAVGTLSITWRYVFKGDRSTFASNSLSPSPFRPPVERPPFPLTMVEIPVGIFLMGATPGDEDTFPNELPQRKVTFTKPFRMSSTEITVGQFREFVRSTGYRTEAELSGKGGWKAKGLTSWGVQRPDYVWSSPGYPLVETLPVTLVTYADAIAFCQWLSRRERKTYRLPTEAEWEYACRAGTTTPTHFPPGTRDFFSWSLHNVKSTVPSAVATRDPNAWGLYDMCGNAREWCLDWYAEDAYRLPYDEFPAGPPKGTKRVVRSGCFIDKEHFLRSSWRGYVLPTEAFNNQGFRVVQVE